MTTDQRVASIAVRQFGLISFDQGLQAGMNPRTLSYRVATGRWMRVHRGVYLIAGAPLSGEGRILAATMAVRSASAVASFQSAAMLWGMLPLRDGPPHLSVPGGKRVRVKGIHVHRPSVLPKSDVTRVGVVPATRPMRTLLDLSGALPSGTLAVAVGESVRTKLIDPKRLLRRVMDDMASGHRGLRNLQELLSDETHPNASGSRAESALWKALKVSSLPLPRREYDVLDRSGRFVARVDFAYPNARLAIDIDGYAYHASPSGFEADRTRHNRLEDAGWAHLIFTANHIKRSPTGAVEAINRGLLATVAVT